jgi:potassium efflux system protein
MLPALNLLDSLELWRVVDTVSAEGGFHIISLFDVIVAVGVLVLTGLFAQHLPSIVQILLMEWLRADSGVRYAAGILTQYVVVGIGVSTALSFVGWEWGKVQWLVAALGVGIGFGLQEIVANFISGLIVLFERPIRVGDTVSVGTTEGIVKKIKSRATVIETFDLKEVMVPNKALITGEVTNWSLSVEATRVMVSVGIAYENDPEQGMALLLEAARETDLILREPEPSATFDDFGDNSLVLTLRCYVGDNRPAAWTKLRSLIFRKFTDAGITIAFPQRDVHLNITRPVSIQLDHG